MPETDENNPNPSTPLKSDEVIVSEQVIKKGTTQVLTQAAFNNPAPEFLKRILKAIRYFCTTLIALISGSTVFTGNQSKYAIFILSASILFTGAVEIAVGVQSYDDMVRAIKGKGAGIVLLLILLTLYILNPKF